MKPATNRQPTPLNAHTLLLAVLGAVGCVDSPNPVLPSTGGPGGLVAGERGDGGTAVEVLWASDVQEVAAGDTVLDANPRACDLLTYVLTQKGCAKESDACYPVGGSGQCLFAGQSVGGTCLLGEGSPSCAGGYACIALGSTMTVGTCLRLCDIYTPVEICGANNPCLHLQGSVGYCRQLPS